ncbi:hypothetical protein PTW35_06835 [Photobacterium sp. DA100]|uniref:hypothetical protein n=1 Tax=Photobacterium sp. DA100 TaxID=3027472 RepID=UPI0024797FC3|nr:hypothetical protein [Photobacterium sp. DA100]WEM43501.1 hypothetical protein PTW35_06835 [Photobacterium sp. DA100]
MKNESRFLHWMYIILAFIAFLVIALTKFGAELHKPSIPAYLTRPPQNSVVESVDEALSNMNPANIAFNVPENLNIEESSIVILKLSLNDTIEQIKELIDEAGQLYGATIKVSDRMEARLSGHNFQITAITAETQAVSKDQNTEWKWEIEPKVEGSHRLHLTLTALLEIDGHNTPRTIRTFSQKITIKVTTAQRIKLFFNNNWQWMWAAILVPVIGWLWSKRKASSSDKSQSPEG